MPTNSVRKSIVNFLTVCISLSVCFFIIEIAVRQLMPWYDPAKQVVYYYNQEYQVSLGHANSSSSVKTPKGDYNIEIFFNQYGLRDQKDLAKSTADNIFVVGDSFSFGWGVTEDERFSDRLQSLMGREVYNISIPSSIPGYQKLIRYAKTKGAKVNHLIIGLCMANDILNYDQKEDRSAPRKFSKNTKEKVRGWLKKHSAVYLLFSFEFQKIRPIQKFFEKIGVSRDIGQIVGSGPNRIYDQDAINSSAEWLKKVMREADDPYVLIIPSLGLWKGPNQLMERKVHDGFLQQLKEMGIDYIDMMPYFEKTNHPDDFYFRSDPHWNAKGHQLAAKVLEQYLASK